MSSLCRLTTVHLQDDIRHLIQDAVVPGNTRLSLLFDPAVYDRVFRDVHAIKPEVVVNRGLV